MAPEEAARALSRREPGVRGTVLAALDHWLILANYEAFDLSLDTLRMSRDRFRR